MYIYIYSFRALAPTRETYMSHCYARRYRHLETIITKTHQNTHIYKAVAGRSSAGGRRVPKFATTFQRDIVCKSGGICTPAQIQESCCTESL